MAAPANDNWAAAEIITGASGTVAFDLTDATSETDETYGANGTTVWYSWTPPATGYYQFDTMLSAGDPDTYLIVFTGPDLADLVVVKQDDDSGNDPAVGDPRFGASKAQFHATEGTTYYVSVDGYAAGIAGVLRWFHITGLPPAGPTEWRTSPTADAQILNSVWSISDAERQNDTGNGYTDWPLDCEGSGGGVTHVHRTGSGGSYEVYSGYAQTIIQNGITALDVDYYRPGGGHFPDLPPVFPSGDPGVSLANFDHVEYENPSGTWLETWRVQFQDGLNFDEFADPTDIAEMHGQMRKATEADYYFDGTTLDSYRFAAPPLRTIWLHDFLTGAELAAHDLIVDRVIDNGTRVQNWLQVLDVADTDTDANGMIPVLFNISYQITHQVPIAVAGGLYAIGGYGAAESNIRLSARYTPPRYRLIFDDPGPSTTIPPLRQFPRDDGLATSSVSRAARAASQQASIRRGPAGTYY